MPLYTDEEFKSVLAKHDKQVQAYNEANGIKDDHDDSRHFEYAKTEMPTANSEYFKSIYRSPEYNRCVNEYFDIADSNTRRILLAVNEADQEKIMVSLTSKLYDAIMDKVDEIDYGEIPDTKGDITKLSNFDKLIECLDTMKKILIEYKQSTDPVDTVLMAINNIEIRKEIFSKGFRYKIELPMVMYNSVVLGIISATTYLVSTTIAFIKTPTNDTFQMTLDKLAMTKSKQHLIFETLAKFNDSCRKGDIDKALDYVIRTNTKNFLGGMSVGVVAGGVAIVTLIFSIIPIIRELIFLQYYTRVRVSEYFDVQATLLQLNAANIEANKTLDKEERDKIVKKQAAIADAFRKISTAVAVKNKDGEKKAITDMTTNTKKYKVDDVVDSVPDSAGSVLF